MDITPELILAGVAVIGAIASALNLRNAARRDVVTLLQNEVARDHDRIAALEKERNELSDLRSELENERDGLQRKIGELTARVTETENRLARAERRAGEAEKQANDFRHDVIRLGEEMQRERNESQTKINKLVLIVEALVEKLKALGADPEIDLEMLRRMSIVEK
jgi:chromosome segregation ATPase